MSKMSELATRVFMARDAAHRAHWKTKSCAAHMALGDFYESVIDKIDDIIETYQGEHGIIDIPQRQGIVPANIVSLLKNEYEWIEKNREAIADECCAVENLLDELMALYLKTLYKLQNLS